ncbi:MAG: formylglycine-generating enzyme family protein [Alphaproteobacteria bacterium]|nr:formylglycine-generating enzyme family protein [Alphaproteobacteria bacterium]
MVAIPGGQLMMAGRFYPDFATPPINRVSVPDFAIGRYEVTFAEWEACVRGGGCVSNPNPNDHGWGRGRRPVIDVSWDQAQEYVQWLSQLTGQHYRLLTSAEWEYAARAGTTTRFSWGDQDPVCDRRARNGANFNGCPEERTRPVGSFQPNAFGLYDMHGNVWELLEDCYQDERPICSARVKRGGSWGEFPHDLPFSSVSASFDYDRYNTTGFRVARAL